MEHDFADYKCQIVSIQNLYIVICNCESGIDAGRSDIIFSDAGSSDIMMPELPAL